VLATEFARIGAKTLLNQGNLCRAARSNPIRACERADEEAELCDDRPQQIRLNDNHIGTRVSKN
jgi:hypothetical protein